MHIAFRYLAPHGYKQDIYRPIRMSFKKLQIDIDVNTDGIQYGVKYLRNGRYQTYSSMVQRKQWTFPGFKMGWIMVLYHTEGILFFPKHDS